MRILVTGSQGTLGRVLLHELRRRGHTVYGCDLKHSDDPLEMRADIAERRQLARVFDAFRPELVYHLAAEFGRMNGQDFYEQLWKSNCIGTRNVIEECLRTNARLAFASSSEAYGESTVYCSDSVVPLEEAWLDKYAPAFHNEYALTKWANERQVFIAAQNHGLRAVVLRFFNAYSEEEYSPYRSVVCLFIYRLMFGLPITVYRNYNRVFMYIGDWARTVANLADPVNINGQPLFDSLVEPLFSGKTSWRGSRPSVVPVYNIGGQEYMSVEELKDKIVALLGGAEAQPFEGRDAELLRFADGHECAVNYLDAENANVTSKRPDITLAKLDLGHDPSTTLDEGLPLAIAWMKKTYCA